MMKSIAIAAAIGLTGGGVAVAQSQTGAALVDALFAQAEAELFGGASSVARARGAMASQTTADHTFNLQAGKTYMAIGVCDENCSDLDVAISGPGGDNLGADVLDDDTPIVAFEATRSGQYKATVLMAACGSARCNYGVRVYEQ